MHERGIRIVAENLGGELMVAVPVRLLGALDAGLKLGAVEPLDRLIVDLLGDVL